MFSELIFSIHWRKIEFEINTERESVVRENARRISVSFALIKKNT